MEYIEYIGKLVNVIRCKGCTAVIAARRGIGRQFRIDKTPEYRLLMIELRDPRDGQLVSHVTPMCATCCDRFRSGQHTQDELNALYDSDKEQWIASTVKTGAAPLAEAQRMCARFADRVPTRALSDRYAGQL